MRKTAFNGVLDAVTYCLLAFQIFTGLMLYWMLPPGTARPGGVGRGAGSKDVYLFLGYDRHQWGSVHFWLAVAFVALMALHLALHWDWIRGFLAHHVGRARVALLGALGVLAGLAIVLPFVLEPEMLKGREFTGDGPSERTGEHRVVVPGGPPVDVRGSMTVAELERASGMPRAEIIRRLKLPAHVDPNENFGALRRRYGFRLSDVRDAVSRWAAENTPSEP